jgi:hypothetical protein
MTENTGPVTQDQGASTNVRSLTFGERLVGLTFNPSNDDKVSKAKKLFAEIADLVNDELSDSAEKTRLQIMLREHTFGEILNAQMNVVKLLTLKY